jgi:tRNA 5-methylaminomethyl-2-thiouridine biosynthesis bifunctional protein
MPHKARKARLPKDWPQAGLEWSQEADPATCQNSFHTDTWPDDEPPALWHPQGFWLKPARLVQAQLAHPNIRLHLNAAVQSLHRDAASSTWQLNLPQGTCGPFDQVILCAGPATLPLLQQTLPSERCPALNPVRGQLSRGPIDDALARVLPPSPVNGDGSFLGNIPFNGSLRWLAGSSFDRSRQEAVLDEADHLENLTRLRTLLPAVVVQLERQYAEGAVQAWAGVRCTTPDRLPRVGAVAPDLAPGLHLLTGLGARGLTLSVLCGQWLAARLCQEPWPLEPELGLRLAADRP